MTPGTILAYHGVGEPPPGADVNNLFVSTERFEEQMAYLAAKREVVPLDRLVGGAPGGRRAAVAITFDDGYRHLLVSALPVLERFGFEATVFVPTKWIGQANVWDPPSECDLAIMNQAELREADARGLKVESHGHAHIDMRSASKGEIAEDLAFSRRLLQEITGREARYLAWPYRDGSEEARDLAASSGFSAAFSIDLPHQGMFSFQRVQVTPRDNRLAFALKTSGRYTQLRHSRVLDGCYRLVKRALRR